MSTIEQQCRREIIGRLVREGEWVFSRGDQDPPNFKSAHIAAMNLLDAYPGVRTILVDRPVVLRPLCEQALERGLKLIMPTKAGPEGFEVPRDALFDAHGRRKSGGLKIHPPPRGSSIYTGKVDLLAVGCLGFTPHVPRLYNHDNERVAYLIDEWRSGLDNGFRVPKSVPVVAIAADCQEVYGWPESMLSFVRAATAVTPTRRVSLDSKGTCEDEHQRSLGLQMVRRQTTQGLNGPVDQKAPTRVITP